MAHIILTPMIPPFDISFAFLICLPNALILALKESLPKSSSKYPGCAADITPIAPSLATAPASEDKLTPTPMPPCIIGTFATKSPIINEFNSIY